MSEPIVCPTCTSTSFVRVEIVTRRHETSLETSTVRPLRSNTTYYDELEETMTWACGVCQAVVTEEARVSLERLLGGAEAVD